MDVVPPAAVLTTRWKLAVSTSMSPFSLLVACMTFLAFNVSDIPPFLGVDEIVVDFDVDVAVVGDIMDGDGNCE